MKRILSSIFIFVLSASIASAQVLFDYNPPPNSASTNTKRLDLNVELDGINADKTDFIDIDTSAELRAIIAGEVGTGPLMFGIAPGMQNDIGCTSLQYIRWNGAGTLWECASLVGTGDVVGPASVTDSNPTVFDGITGKLIKQQTFAQFKTSLVLVKGDVGLGSVDNTSDVGKPVSTAQQTALDLKANLAGPTFTGVPVAPTAVALTNTTQLATTAFVTTADNLKANLASPTFTGAVTVSSGSLGLTGNQSVAAWTTSGVRYKNVAATLIDTTSVGTVATAYTNAFGGNTIAASSVATFTNYFNSYFADPTAGTNVTLTNKWAVGADSLKIGTSNPVTVTPAGIISAGSPTFTGVPTAPTAAANTNTTQLATTAFVTTADNLKANLAGPALTGVPTAPTAANGTNTTQLATTAFAIANGGSGMVLLATLTTTSGTTQSATGLVPASYRQYYIEVDGVSGAGGNISLEVSISGNNGANYGTPVQIAAVVAIANSLNGAFVIGTINKLAQYGSPLLSGGIQSDLPGVTLSLSGTTLGKHATGGAGAVDAIRFHTSNANTFDAGTIRIYGVK